MIDMNKYDEEKLKQQIKSVLDESVEKTDTETRHQLQMIRANVLESEPKSVWRSHWPMFGGVAGFASIVALGVFLFITPLDHMENHNDVLIGLDTILFEADTNMELYEQYDFYVWLSGQETNS